MVDVPRAKRQIARPIPEPKYRCRRVATGSLHPITASRAAFRLRTERQRPGPLQFLGRVRESYRSARIELARLLESNAYLRLKVNRNSFCSGRITFTATRTPT